MMSRSVSRAICAGAGAVHIMPHASSNAAHAVRMAVIAASPRGSMLEKRPAQPKDQGPKAKPDWAFRQQSWMSFRDAAISAFTRVFDALRRRARNPAHSELPAFSGFRA